MQHKKAIGAFFSENDVQSIKKYGTGHIHDTFLVCLQDKRQFILQKINDKIFKQIDWLQENILHVTNHLKQQLPNTVDTEIQNQQLSLVPTLSGESYYQAKNHTFWRCFKFIENSMTYDRILNPALAIQAGGALGKFIRDLDGFKHDSLAITIPDFHDIRKRLDAFQMSKLKDSKSRLIAIIDEVEFVEIQGEKYQSIVLSSMSHIPLRVTHNDPKISNILFNKQQQAICLIDFDTIMPGYLFHDFGDAIRTGAASASEDIVDSNLMYLRLDLFDAYTKGFLSETKSILTSYEIDMLAIAPQIMTFIIGMRFLTDYLNGDTYFKIQNEEHNLIRWKAQKALLISMQENEFEMKKIISKY